jgi:hypothetical protein
MTTRIPTRLATRLFAPALALLLGGCVSTESNLKPAAVEGGGTIRGDGFLTVVVGPGESRGCNNTSCRIYYRMPDLDAPAQVAVNHFQVGTFPPGEVVDLGTWSDPIIRIRVVGADVPRAYVNMIGDSAL